MLNYSAMKNHLKLIYIAPLLLALVMVGCSSSTDETGNQNAPQAANTNTTPPVAQTAPPPNPTPSITPTPVPAPPQLTPPAAPNAQNANKAAATLPTNKPAAGATGTPKLTVLTKDKGLDFGKQPQDKSLVRPIQIKNTGTAELKIETVAPG